MIKVLTPKAGQVALTFFFGLMDKWAGSASEQKILLGSVANTTYHKYKSLHEIRLSHDLLERISSLMGIHKSLCIIFSNQVDTAYRWAERFAVYALWSYDRTVGCSPLPGRGSR